MTVYLSSHPCESQGLILGVPASMSSDISVSVSEKLQEIHIISSFINVFLVIKFDVVEQQTHGFSNIHVHAKFYNNCHK